MSSFPSYLIDDQWIHSRRGNKNIVDLSKPYAFLVEQERSASGVIEDTAVIFLTNNECPFHCLMCDLWKNTTENPVKPGIIPGQIGNALANIPAARQVKLYNSGSFFDKNAIPPEDFEAIAGTLEGFKTVIVESHPAFIGKNCLGFRDMLKGKLEIAIGLETVNSELIKRLNKKMSLNLFSEKISFLSRNNINTRAFILLRPPFMTEEEGIYWAKRSIDFAFNAGVGCCTIIPVRHGNGAMDELMKLGYFSLPSIRSLEDVLEYGISLGAGRVFADTWDLRLFSECNECFQKRVDRITEMNLNQTITPEVRCTCQVLGTGC